MRRTRPSSALLAPLAPALADLLSGQWELLYTTSGSILGASRPALLRPTGPTYQVLGEAPCRRCRRLGCGWGAGLLSMRATPCHHAFFPGLPPLSQTRRR